jgi:hypothetical protein
LQSHVDIEIHVIDINDKMPTFKQTYYTPQISEDYPLNTPIINFTVTDDDARNTPNSNITLDLIDPYGKFSIFNDTRVSTSNNIQAYLIAKERLDYESLSPLDRQYKLKIIARDHGQPKSLQSEAQIYITITDVNDEVKTNKTNFFLNFLLCYSSHQFLKKILYKKPLLKILNEEHLVKIKNHIF